jgi:hypothetical protein
VSRPPERAGHGGELSGDAAAAAAAGAAVGCARPVRLVGRVEQVDTVTGEVRETFTSAGRPGGVLHVNCRNRRVGVCPACSATYQGDARRIVLEGLGAWDGEQRGAAPDGAGSSSSGSGRPAVFVTVTAPSFGPVHSRRLRPGGGPARACHPRRGGCVHGRAAGCRVRHGDGDPLLGSPICADCYDYPGQVVWNALAGRLWDRTRDGMYRELARAAGLSVSGLRAAVRLTAVKVAEMQGRGVVHFHAVIRLDGRGPDGEGCPAPPWAGVGVLADAVRAAAGAARVACPDLYTGQGAFGGVRGLGGGFARWGRQLDVRPLTLGGDTSALAVGNYLAKYVTKSVHDGGGLDHPVRSYGHLARLELPAHARRLVETCWTLGHTPTLGRAVDRAAGRLEREPAGLVRWAHSFGFGGHWLTKSRTYSTTFGALRAVRAEHARTAVWPGGVERDAWGRPAGTADTVTLADWTYAGVGYQTAVERENAPGEALRAALHAASLLDGQQ